MNTQLPHLRAAVVGRAGLGAQLSPMLRLGCDRRASGGIVNSCCELFGRGRRASGGRACSGQNPGARVAGNVISWQINCVGGLRVPLALPADLEGSGK